MDAGPQTRREESRAMGYLYRRMFTKGQTLRVDGRAVRCAYTNLGEKDVCQDCGATFGQTWWLKGYANGRPVRENTGTDERQKAESTLKVKEGRPQAGSRCYPGWTASSMRRSRPTSAATTRRAASETW
jgi:hypothetical protein